MAIEIRLARRLIFDIFVHVNNGKTIVKHPMFDGLYHPFMVILGMVYYCLTTLVVLVSLVKMCFGEAMLGKARCLATPPRMFG